MTNASQSICDSSNCSVMKADDIQDVQSSMATPELRLLRSVLYNNCCNAVTPSLLSSPAFNETRLCSKDKLECEMAPDTDSADRPSSVNLDTRTHSDCRVFHTMPEQYKTVCDANCTGSGFPALLTRAPVAPRELAPLVQGWQVRRTRSSATSVCSKEDARTAAGTALPLGFITRTLPLTSQQPCSVTGLQASRSVINISPMYSAATGLLSLNREACTTARIGANSHSTTAAAGSNALVSSGGWRGGNAV